MAGVIEDIVKKMPFRDEIVEWCEQHDDFLQALKIVNSERFAHFAGISITTTTNMPRDQIIGVIVYDKRAQILKQDFIVDEGFTHTSFVYYTSLPGGYAHLYGPRVKRINKFYDVYGRNGHYADTHHPRIDSLDPSIQDRVNEYLSRSGQRLRDPRPYRRPTQREGFLDRIRKIFWQYYHWLKSKFGPS